MRLEVSPGLAAWLTERIAAYAEESPPHLRGLAEFAAEAGALPLYDGWYETIALRPDGEVVSWSGFGDYPGTKTVEDRYIWLTSLVDAARRYPELRALLPSRPPEARDCLHLAHPMFATGKVFCPECCALGWVVASDADSSSAANAWGVKFFSASIEHSDSAHAVPGRSFWKEFLMAKRWWNKVTGVTKAKRKFAHVTGIPTTRSGRRAKAGRMAGCSVLLVALGLTTGGGLVAVVAYLARA
jgi:hypothetical protein